MSEKATSKPTVKERLERLRHLVGHEAWSLRGLAETGRRGILLSAIRLGAILWGGITRNNLPMRSGYLSFITLLSLGPLLAIAVMISGFVLGSGGNQTAVATETLNRILLFVAPALGEFAQTDGGQAVNPELVAVLEGFIESAQSGAVGVVGLLVLVWIGIGMLTSIETTFNEIWGVRKGRAFHQRIILYWTLITLGSLLGFASLTLLSTAAITSTTQSLPFGENLTALYTFFAPLVSFGLIVALLTGFYRFIPNTSVHWRPAISGAITVALLQFALNYFSFLLVSQAITYRNLYGSVAILPVLMVGLFIFWLLLLFGGQLTYAVQNVNVLAHQAAWQGISQQTRENVSFAALVLACRRFAACGQPPSMGELTGLLRVPDKVLNETLARLVESGWLATAQVERGGENVPQYLPARPLEKMDLTAFRRDLARYGNNEGDQLIEGIDPAIDAFRESVSAPLPSGTPARTMAELLTAYPSDG